MAYAGAHALPGHGVDGDSPMVSQPPTPAEWFPLDVKTVSQFAAWVDLFLTEPYINHPDQYQKGLL